MTIPSMLTHLSMIRTIPSSYRADVAKGTIFADAGYLQKKDALKRMEEKGIKFEAAPNVPALFL